MEPKVHIVPDTQQPDTWTWSPTLTFRRETESGYEGLRTPEEIRRVWNQYAEDFAEPFRSALLALPGDAHIWCERLAQWPSVRWEGEGSGGRVTLAGDAAHPMTYRESVTFARFPPFGFFLFLLVFYFSCED